jgi:hypothetical protein
MALREETNLKSVEILPISNTIQLLWETKIYRDDDIIAYDNFRRAYGSNEKNAFMKDLGEESNKYINNIVWDVEEEIVQPETTIEG